MSVAPTDFFVSYRHTQEKWAEWIAWALEDAGFHVDLDKWDLPPGGNIVSYIHGALQRANQVLAVVSTDYFGSGWTEAEWTAALASGIQENRNRLVLVKIEPCQIDGILSPYRFVDLYKYNDEDAKKALLDAVETARRKPVKALSPRGEGGNTLAFPSYFPPIWNVPDPNLLFVGRQAEIDSIYRGLHSSGQAAITAAQSIVGLGGVGKTQLALEYAYRYRGEYDTVWWIDAEGGAPTIKIKLSDLGVALGFAHQATSEFESVLREVTHWLRSNVRWLLIFDNVASPHELQDFVTGQLSGHVLITSRNVHWTGLAKQIDLDIFEIHDACEFLCRRAGLLHREGATRVCEQLGCLPLALEQAGAYIEQIGLTFDEYLELYEAYGMKVLDPESNPKCYPTSVRTTWEISFSEIRRISQESANVLHCLSFFAPDEIPLSLLAEQADVFPNDMRKTFSDTIELNRVMKPLRDYSLIKRSNRSVRLHRMVQAVIRDALTREMRRSWSGTAVKVLEGGLPADVGDDARTWPIAGRLLSHVLAASGFAERENAVCPELAAVLGRIGVYQTRMAAFAAGEVSLQRALALSCKVNGAEHYDTGILTNNLGQHYQSRHRLADARELYTRALSILVEHLGPEHSAIATILNNLAEVASELGQYDFSLQMHRRALRIRELQLGSEHRDTAESLNNIGLLCQKMGDYERAETALRQALKIDEHNFGRDAPRVATTLNNLGLLYNALADYDGAQGLFKEALIIRKNHFTRQHPHVCQVTQNLAVAYCFGGRYREAESLFREALLGWNNSLDPDDPNLAACNLNMGTCLLFLGRVAEGVQRLEQAQRINCKNRGESDPECRWLAHILDVLGSGDERRINELIKKMKADARARTI
jgi:tetratricopeptide (TPR) repeat protein